MAKVHTLSHIVILATLVTVLHGTTAQAVILLPLGATGFRFDAITAFETSYDPFIDVTNGNIVAPQPADGALMLTAFGEVHTIQDVTDAGNLGSIIGELTFAYTGATLTPLGAPVPAGATTNSRTYSISTILSGGALTFYDDDLLGTQNLNTALFFNQPAVVPVAAIDGDVYLMTTTPADTAATILITYFRPNATSNFNRYTINLQIANGGAFDIFGGTLLADAPTVDGEAVLISQLGPYSTLFQSKLVNGTLRNQSVNSLIEGSFELRTTTPVPEPVTAVLSLLSVSALTTPLLRRRGHT